MRNLGLAFLLVACSGTGLPTSGGTGGTGGTTGGGTTTGGTTGNQQKLCGGFAGAQCASDEWCDFPDKSSCGGADAAGICQKRPQTCPDLYGPVCGCDYITYSNSCYANAAGVDVVFTGPCESPPLPPDTCGAETGATCANDEYCYFTPGEYCDWADSVGKCMKRPTGCNLLYAPVCGCDNKTYSNECDAASQGQGAAYNGECGKPTADCRTTGCPSGKKCELCWTSWECLDPNVAC